MEGKRQYFVAFFEGKRVDKVNQLNKLILEAKGREVVVSDFFDALLKSGVKVASGTDKEEIKVLLKDFVDNLPSSVISLLHSKIFPKVLPAVVAAASKPSNISYKDLESKMKSSGVSKKDTPKIINFLVGRGFLKRNQKTVDSALSVGNKNVLDFLNFLSLMGLDKKVISL